MTFKVESYSNFLEHINTEYIEPGEGEVAEGLIADYNAGATAHYLLHKYGVSAGQLYSHLHAKKVPKRTHSYKLRDKIAEFSPQELNNIVDDYQRGMDNKKIYEKYGIHKNGLYYLLDVSNVPRKNARKKELAE